MSMELNYDEQTERIVRSLCDEINSHNEVFSRTNRSGSFAKSLLSKNRTMMQKHYDSYSEKDLEFSMDDLDLSTDETKYVEQEPKFNESFDVSENISEEEAIEAIISAINRMAMKIDKDPKISNLLQKTSSEESTSKNFSRFNSLIFRLLEDATPGIAVDSWGNAIFFMIIALKISELKSYPQDFFKKYVYDKIVPWVTQQPNGWMSAKYDEKVGNVVKNEFNKQPVVPITFDRSDSSTSDYASSPSSLLSWFTFPKSRTHSFSSET